MRTRIGALTLTALASCAAAERLTVLSATPAGIELTAWCAESPCEQMVADAAQIHCRRGGRDAQLADSELMQRSFTLGERRRYRFNCVR